MSGRVLRCGPPDPPVPDVPSDAPDPVLVASLLRDRKQLPTRDEVRGALDDLPNNTVHVTAQYYEDRVVLRTTADMPARGPKYACKYYKPGTRREYKIERHGRWANL